MEIVILVFLFIVGTVTSAYQAMRYLERRHQKKSGSNQPSHKA
jgi:uncharacterized membrane protein YidH (DUF202 family)